MKNLYITSLEPGAGKTTFTIMLALKLRQVGKKVGYFKPITDLTEDSDAKDAKQMLEMQEDLTVICPALVSMYEYDMSDADVADIWQKIKAAYQQLHASYDLLLIEGCRSLRYLGYLGLSSRELAKELDAKLLLLAKGMLMEDIDEFILAKEYFASTQTEVVGGVMTRVSDQQFDNYKNRFSATMAEKMAFTIFGLIPDQSNLVAPTVVEIASAIDAKVIAGEQYMDNLVENYIIGAMEPEAALKYFRRSINKAVVTGGDRPQLAIAALETSTSVIILTGSLMPPARVLAKAEEKHVPILLVPSDTFTTIRRLTDHQIFGKIHSNQPERLKAWDSIMDEIDYPAILHALEA